MGRSVPVKEVFYDWGGVNVWLFHCINNIRFEFLDKIMLAGTSVGSHELFGFYSALLGIAAIFALSKKDTSRLNVQLWISTLAILSIAYVIDGWFLGAIKPFLNFPRPPLALPLENIHIIGVAEYHHSLPSGHSSFAMLVVASIWPLLLPWQKKIGLFFVIWVGLSRISLGAHFPADVLAGWISSLMIVLLVRKSVNHYINKASA